MTTLEADWIVPEGSRANINVTVISVAERISDAVRGRRAADASIA